MASIVLVLIGRSRSLRALICSSRPFRDIENAACILELLPRDFGLLTGPLHSVTTVLFTTGGSELCSLAVMMLGAILGVALRSESTVRISTIFLGSLRNLNGLFGGGPGVSEQLRGGSEHAILEALCNSTGWLASLRGDGCLSSMSFASPLYLAILSSCDVVFSRSGRLVDVIAGRRLLVSALTASRDDLGGRSMRSVL